jgi:hypothetical protein
MRHFVSGALALSCLLLLLSCASIPDPEDQQSTLVIGSFILEYPDGVMDLPPRTIASNVWITVMNTTKGSSFSVRTMDGGFFYFLGSGDDSYSLQSYRHTFTMSGTSEYTVGAKLNWAFKTAPGQITYLGHTVIRQGKPKMAEERQGSRERQSTWQFETTLTRDDTPDRMIEYLRTQHAESPWLLRTVASAQIE